MKKLALILLLFTNIGYAQNSFFQWATSYGNSGDENGKSIATDAAGNVYTLGDFRNTVDFDPSPATLTLTSNGSSDLFIVKLDMNGNTLWAKSIGNSNAEYASAIAVDPAGDIYVTGGFFGTMDFDPNSGVANMTPTGGVDVFVLKLSSSGSFLWAKKMGGTGSEYGNSITVSSAGDVYTTGFYSFTADFDPGIGVTNLSAVGGTDIFVSKLSASGNFVWAKSFGGNGAESGLGIATNTSGIVFTGSFQGVPDFNPSVITYTLNSFGSNDPFLCKLDFNGNMLWAFNIGGSGADQANAIATDSNNDIIITGQFNGTATFNPSTSTNTLTSLGSTDVFIAKYSNAGSFVWVKKFGGSFAENSIAIAVDDSANIYTTGSFKNTVDFDPNVGTFTITSNANSFDSFIHKLDATGNFGWAKTIGDLNDEVGNGVCVYNTDHIFTIGTYKGAVDFDTDANILTLTSVGAGYDAYVHKLGSCVTPTNTTSNANLNICTGQNATLSASGSGLLTWYPTSSSTSSLANGPTYSTPILSTGTYSYYVESSTCSQSATRMQVTVTVSACTGLNESSAGSPSFNVYPNPSSGNFVLDFDHDAKLLVFDPQGKQIINSNISAGKDCLDLTMYTNGLYSLKVHGNSKTINIRLVKE